jgi:SAM-dependent methyltransferase
MITKFKDSQYYDLQNSRSGGHLDNNILEGFIGDINFKKDKDKIYIIDIGCRGHANIIRKLIGLGFVNTFGIDIGENAEVKWIDYPFKNNLKRADIHEGIPFDYKFDLVSCSHTLEHCYNPNLVIDIIKNTFEELGYLVEVWLLNAAEYGVPQIRERVFIIGNNTGKKIGAPPKRYSLGLLNFNHFQLSILDHEKLFPAFTVMKLLLKG